MDMPSDTARKETKNATQFFFFKYVCTELHIHMKSCIHVHLQTLLERREVKLKGAKIYDILSA